MTGVRVLQVIDSLAPGGAETSLAAMAPGLAGRGIDLAMVAIADRDGLRDVVEAGGIPVDTLGTTSRVATIRELGRVIQRFQPDIVHTSLFEADVAGRIAAARARVPVVSSLVTTSYGAGHVGQPGVPLLRLRGAQLADLVTARLVRRFHAVSATVADTMSRRLHVRRGLIDVIWRGRDPVALGRRTPERATAARDSLAVGPDDRLVVMLSRQEREKGIDVAIDAVKTLVADWPDLRLVVAGREGNATPSLEAQIARLGLSSVVQLIGRRQDAAELLCAADAFIAPSRREGLPGAVLEAMALEAPIVASDIPAVREAVPDGSVAVLVPVEDPAALAHAVANCLTDTSAAAERSRRARRRFEECFTLERSVTAMVAFYERVQRGASDT